MADEVENPRGRKLFGDITAVFTAGLVFVSIAAFAGPSAAVWFCLGFNASAIVAFWEAGRGKALLAQRNK